MSDAFAAVLGNGRGASTRDRSGNVLTAHQAVTLQRLLAAEELGGPSGAIVGAGMLAGELLVGYAEDFDRPALRCLAIGPSGEEAAALPAQMLAASCHPMVERVMAEYGDAIR